MRVMEPVSLTWNVWGAPLRITVVVGPPVWTTPDSATYSAPSCPKARPRGLLRPVAMTELTNVVAKQIGSFAKPDQIRFTDALPKTRSGKIMRRLLKELAGGGEVKGDTTTLEDFSVLAKLKESDEG